MLLKDINPFVRLAVSGGVGIAYNNTTDIFRHLKTPDCRLFYITNGNGKMKLNDKVYNLKPDSAILFQSGTEYIWDTKHADIFSLNFDYTMNFSHITTPFHPVHSGRFQKEDVLENIHFEDANVLNSPIYIQDASFIKPILRTIISTYHLSGSFTPEMLSSHMKVAITAIVYRISNAKSYSGGSATIDTVNRIIEYIQSNYHTDIQNSDIAEIFHFNHSYAGRIFKQHTGVSMHQFLINHRINLAKELLRTKSSSIHVIAHEVGFNDSHHFVKYFKKAVGKTPTEYRKSATD